MEWLGSTGQFAVVLCRLGVDRRALCSLILPGPLEVIAQLKQMFSSGIAGPELIISGRRTLYGLALALGVGSLLGMFAGFSITTSMLARPLITLLLGMPPIAWLVLAMLWFGLGDATPVFTVFVACLPIVFAGAMQGTRTLDNHLKAVAQVYRLPCTCASPIFIYRI